MEPGSANGDDLDLGLTDSDLYEILEGALIEPVAVPMEDDAMAQCLQLSPASSSDLDTNPDSTRGSKKRHGTFPDCKVCGRANGATKSAFGGRSCPSCRAFFQRIVLAKKHEHLRCQSKHSPNKCAINSRSWRSCNKCRFDRCLNMAGMRVELVSNSSMPSKQLEKQQPHPLPTTTTIQTYTVIPTPKSVIPDQFTLEEEILLKGLRDHTIKSFLSVVLSNGPRLAHDMLECMTSGCTASKEHNLRVARSLMNSSHLFFDTLSDLQQLKPSDRTLLLKGNFPMVLELFHASALQSTSNTQKHLSRFITYINFESKRPDLQKVLQAFNAVALNNRSMILKYDQLYDNGFFPDPQKFAKHKELILTMGRRGAKDPNLDDPEEDELLTTLIAMTLLFSPKCVQMLSPASLKVLKNAQAKYSHIMYKYLRRKYDDSVAMALRFADSMTTEDLARESATLRWEAANMQMQGGETTTLSNNKD